MHVSSLVQWWQEEPSSATHSGLGKVVHGGRREGMGKVTPGGKRAPRCRDGDCHNGGDLPLSHGFIRTHRPSAEGDRQHNTDVVLFPQSYCLRVILTQYCPVLESRPPRYMPAPAPMSLASPSTSTPSQQPHAPKSRPRALFLLQQKGPNQRCACHGAKANYPQSLLQTSSLRESPPALNYIGRVRPAQECWMQLELKIP